MGVLKSLANKLFGKNEVSQESEEVQVEIKPYTGQPFHFGYKSSWYVIRTESTEEVAQFIKELSEGSLQTSLFRVPGWNVTISSPYKGWVFLFCGLEPDLRAGIPEFKTFMTLLSERFGEAQFFGTHRVSEYHCWAKATNGKLIRLYSFAGDAMENIHVEGESLEPENKYQLINTFSPKAKAGDYFDTPGLVTPDENLVMEIAGSWSVDPTKFSEKEFEEIWTNALIVTRTK